MCFVEKETANQTGNSNYTDVIGRSNLSLLKGTHNGDSGEIHEGKWGQCFVEHSVVLVIEKPMEDFEQWLILLVYVKDSQEMGDRYRRLLGDLWTS